jgi:adenylate kinase
MGKVKVKARKHMQHRNMPRVIALTGTPGTGKTSLAGHLATQGWRELDLTELARRGGAVVGRDEERDTDEVDVDLLRKAVEDELSRASEDERVLLVGHMAHLMPCDAVVVLRCSPSVLEGRLVDRGYRPEKVRENMEAEAVGVLLVEAMELEDPVPVYEIDTTAEPLEGTASRLVAVLSGVTEGMEAGWVDWSEEVMGWY